MYKTTIREGLTKNCKAQHHSKRKLRPWLNLKGNLFAKCYIQFRKNPEFHNQLHTALYEIYWKQDNWCYKDKQDTMACPADGKAKNGAQYVLVRKFSKLRLR